MSLVFEVCCTIPGTRTYKKASILDRNIFSHVDVVLPRKSDFTLKMPCMHHIIPNRYIHPSGGFYSWLFGPDHGGNRTTKLCLGTYLTPLVMTVCKTSKSYTRGGGLATEGRCPRVLRGNDRLGSQWVLSGFLENEDFSKM